MRTLFLMLALVLVTGAASAKETDPRINPRILSSFKKEFSTASNVRWEVRSDYVKAHFILNDQGLIAYFDKEGEMMSVARNLLYNQLPLSVIKGLQEKYGNAVFSSIVEVTREGETSYLMETEKKGKKLMIQAASNGYVTVVKTTRL